jgi:AsmA family protein
LRVRGIETLKLTGKTVLLYSGISIVALLVTCVLVLTFMDWNRFKGPIERRASAASGRAVIIGGPLQVKLWSRTPTITINELTIGGPQWDASHALARVERVQIQIEALPLLRGRLILHRLELNHPELYLHQEKSGRANWTSENNAPTKERAAAPTRIPAIRDLVIDSGRITLIDEQRKLKLRGTVVAHERAADNDLRPFHLEGSGTINEEPFKLDVAGGALQALNPDHPYPFLLAITAGENQIRAEGRVLKPFDLGALDLQVSASGRDLAELYHLTQITLPNTPPYKLRAHLTRDGQQLRVRDITGSLGQSDISGKVDIDASTKRPFVRADLVSRHLLLKDFAAVTGSRTGEGASLDSATHSESAPVKSAPEPATPKQLFPDAHLQVTRLKAIDADVHFRATSIEAGTVPFTQVVLGVRLEDSVLTLDPLRFDMGEGRLNGSVHIDGRTTVPKVKIEMRAEHIRLAQFRAKDAPAPPLDGTLEARAVISGSGDSVHNIMSNADGRLTAIIPNGDIRAAFAELTGIDVAKGIGLLLEKNTDRANIRCGVAQFDVKQGTAHVQNVVLDTQNVLITGGGQVYLGPETLDLTIQGQPKKLHLLRIRSPIEVKGHLLSPHFRLETGHTIKQAAIATALGTLLTPLAAILAFVDPGLAKNQNCEELLAQAEPAVSTKSAAAPPPTPPRGTH